MALAEVMTEEEIYLVTRPIAEGNWTPAEAALLQVVDDLYCDDCVCDAPGPKRCRTSAKPRWCTSSLRPAATGWSAGC